MPSPNANANANVPDVAPTNYSTLTTEQQAQIVDARILQLEQEHYGFTLLEAEAVALNADAGELRNKRNEIASRIAVNTKAKADLHAAMNPGGGNGNGNG